LQGDFEHINRYVTGLVISPNKTLQGIYDWQVCPLREVDLDVNNLCFGFTFCVLICFEHYLERCSKHRFQFQIETKTNHRYCGGDPAGCFYTIQINKEDSIMRQLICGTLATFMLIAFSIALPSMSFAGEGKWTKKANMPTPRPWLSTSVVDGKIYAIGGWSRAGTLSAVEEYNPATNTWTKKANMPTPRSQLSTSVVDGKIYAIGGWRQGGSPIQTVEEYDPTTDTWTPKTDMPTARYGIGASAVNGKIYAIGGQPPGVWAPGSSAVEEYDPATDTWTKKADMPTRRGDLSTSVVDGKIYAIGGRIGNHASVEEYTPVGWPFPASVSPQDKLVATWGKLKAI